MHRREYIEADFSGPDGDARMRDLHHRYYGQYVTPEVVRLLERRITRKEILESTDRHFNDIPLALWDRLVPFLGSTIAQHLKENGDWMGLGSGVCILKAAAEKMRRGEM